MKKIIFWLVAVILALLIAIGFTWKRASKWENKWEIAEANVKEYDRWYTELGSKNAALQLTIDQVNYFKDSILVELNNTRKELKVKDKNLKALQAISSKFSKKDTITITQVDTLFKEPTLAIDTLLGDKWYSLRLGLEYPSMIVVKPEFKSEKHIVVSSKKETVNPPKKFFLFRLFQKKHLVLHIDVDEKNPYVSGESSKYVEILK